jgi:hypothetical protein
VIVEGEQAAETVSQNAQNQSELSYFDMRVFCFCCYKYPLCIITGTVLPLAILSGAERLGNPVIQAACCTGAAVIF